MFDLVKITLIKQKVKNDLIYFRCRIKAKYLRTGIVGLLTLPVHYNLDNKKITRIGNVKVEDLEFNTAEEFIQFNEELKELTNPLERINGLDVDMLLKEIKKLV